MRRVALVLAAGLLPVLFLAHCASGRNPARTVGTARSAAAGAAPAASPAPTVTPAVTPAGTPAPGAAGPAPADAAPSPVAPPAAVPSPAPSTEPAGRGSRTDAPNEPIDFNSRIVPLLQERCSPCHFPGGRMYARLPFDQEATIRLLGTKLFSRLREPEDQELVGAFLEQDPKPAP